MIDKKFHKSYDLVNMIDLLNEVKTSARNPLSLKSFYVLFITAFVLLLVPLTVIGVIYQGNLFAQAKNSCAKPAERTFSGSTSENVSGQHTFTFSGSGCTLTAWVNGSEGTNISLWVYEPDNKINVIDENTDKSYEFFHSSELAKEGDYRITVRLISGESSDYTATVSFR